MWLDRLKQMKASSGLTTREIAIRSNLPEPTLEKIFSGATKDPKLSTIRQLTHFLGFTLDDLESDDGLNKPSIISGEYLTPVESQLLTDFRSLNQAGQEYIRQTMAMALHAYSEKNNAVPNMETAL